MPTTTVTISFERVEEDNERRQLLTNESLSKVFGDSDSASLFLYGTQYVETSWTNLNYGDLSDEVADGNDGIILYMQNLDTTTAIQIGLNGGAIPLMNLGPGEFAFLPYFARDNAGGFQLAARVSSGAANLLIIASQRRTS